MDYFDQLRTIQDMLDRADPGRQIREQMASVQPTIDSGDIGRQLREQHTTLLDRLESADIGQLSEQQATLLDRLESADIGRQLSEQQATLLDTMDRMDPLRDLPEPQTVLQDVAHAFESPVLEFGDLQSTLDRRLDDTQRMLDLYQPVQDAVTRISRTYAGIEDALSASVRLFSDQGIDLEPLRHQLTSTAESVLAAYSQYATLGTEGLANYLRKQPSWLEDLRVTPSPVLGMLGWELAASSEHGVNQGLVDGFGAGLLHQIGQALEAKNEDEVSEKLMLALSWLFSQIKRLPSTRLSNSSLLQILVLLITLSDTRFVSNNSEKRILKAATEAEASIERRLDEMEERILVAVEASDEGSDSHFQVKAHLNLRRGPGTEFEVLTVLAPNSLVKAMAQEGEWVRVEFFDLVDGELSTGWVAEEYLVELPD